MRWRVWPQLNDLYYRRSTNIKTRTPSGGIEIGGIPVYEFEVSHTGDAYAQLSGDSDYHTEFVVSGGAVCGGSASLSGTEATITVSGGINCEGATLDAEAVIPVSGGIVMGGEALIAYPFTYGYWGTYGWWCSQVGWWWDAKWQYNQVKD